MRIFRKRLSSQIKVKDILKALNNLGIKITSYSELVRNARNIVDKIILQTGIKMEQLENDAYNALRSGNITNIAVVLLLLINVSTTQVSKIPTFTKVKNYEITLVDDPVNPDMVFQTQKEIKTAKEFVRNIEVTHDLSDLKEYTSVETITIQAAEFLTVDDIRLLEKYAQQGKKIELRYDVDNLMCGMKMPEERATELKRCISAYPGCFNFSLYSLTNTILSGTSNYTLKHEMKMYSAFLYFKEAGLGETKVEGIDYEKCQDLDRKIDERCEKIDCGTDELTCFFEIVQTILDEYEYDPEQAVMTYELEGETLEKAVAYNEHSLSMGLSGKNAICTIYADYGEIYGRKKQLTIYRYTGNLNKEEMGDAENHVYNLFILKDGRALWFDLTYLDAANTLRNEDGSFLPLQDAIYEMAYDSETYIEPYYYRKQSREAIETSTSPRLKIEMYSVPGQDVKEYYFNRYIANVFALAMIKLAEYERKKRQALTNGSPLGK